MSVRKSCSARAETVLNWLSACAHNSTTLSEACQVCRALPLVQCHRTYLHHWRHQHLRLHIMGMGLGVDLMVCRHSPVDSPLNGLLLGCWGLQVHRLSPRYHSGPTHTRWTQRSAGVPSMSIEALEWGIWHMIRRRRSRRLKGRVGGSHLAKLAAVRGCLEPSMSLDEGRIR